ncbi:MAG TPA: S1/P1 nuclease [Caulobacteraceae bacterium]
MRALIFALAAASFLVPTVASAWGSEGHEIVAAIARDELTPQARSWVDSQLALDKDALTAPDMLSRATWADAWRGDGHRETASWHFVDIELDKPDLAAACYGFPASHGPASAGPAHDCVVDKINEFVSEISSPATPEPERILALKYVLHFVGDLHQPLHASDDHDRGGNCVEVAVDGHPMNLHAYWDIAVLEPLGRDPAAAARALEGEITPAKRAAWAKGTPTDWARESYAIAKGSVYTIGSAVGCGASRVPIHLSAAYQEHAQAVAKVQLEKAGVRLAAILNRASAHAITP